jgi:hypothetical protein
MEPEVELRLLEPNAACRFRSARVAESAFFQRRGVIQ